MISTEQLMHALDWRYAVKKFDNTKQIPAGTWRALEDSLVLSASSYGLQPWKFLVVTDKETRKKLTPVSWNQTQIEDCSHLVVFAAKEKMDEAHIDAFLEKTAKVRNIELSSLEGYKKMMLGDIVNGPRGQVSFDWAARQTYLALGSFLTAAALLEIDTCAMEGIDPLKYDEILGLKGSGWRTVVVCPVGYRATDDVYAKLKKVRFDHENVVRKI